MTVKTNKVITPEVQVTNASGYSAQTKSTNLTASRAMEYQDRAGTIADLQNIQDNAAAVPSYYFDGSGTKYISLPTSTQLLPGSGESTHLIIGKFAAGSTGDILFRFALSENMVYSRINTNNTVRFLQWETGASNYTNTDSTMVLTEYANKPIAIAIVRSKANSGTVQFFFNGVAEAAKTSQTFRSPSGTPTECTLGYTSDSVRNGTMYRQVHFNYALTEDKIRRYSAGAKLDFDDIGGSMALVNNANAGDSDFTSASGWWTEDSSVDIQVTVAGKCTWRDAPSTNGIYRMSVLTIGKRYRYEFKLDSISKGYIGVWHNGLLVSNVTKDGVVQSFTPGQAGYYANTTGIWVIEGIATDTRITLLCSGETTADVDYLYVRQLGAVLDLEPENITDLTWFDSSPNGLHGSVSGAIANRFIPQYSSKNYIINGRFDFWQRNTTYTTVGLTDDYYAADRWRIYAGGAGAIVSRVQTYPYTAGTGLYVMQLYVGSGDLYVRQRIESVNAQNLYRKTFTVSFWAIRTAGSKDINMSLYYPSSTDNFSSLTHFYGGNKNVMLTSSWKFYSFTVPASTANIYRGIELALWFNNDVNNTTVQIANVMLNEGPVPAQFELAGGSIGGELALCQRYFRTCDLGVRALDYDASNFYFGYNFQMMRAVPTLYTNSPAIGTDFSIGAPGGSSYSGFTISGISTSTTSFTRFTVYKATHGYTDASFYIYDTNKIGLSAEL